MNDELIRYYIELLIIQYNSKPKARSTIEALIMQLMIYDLAIKVRDGYNIDDAIGLQLDILGKYLGSDRIVTGTSFTRDYFGFCEYGNTVPFTFNPYIKYGDIAPDVQYRRYEESVASLFELNDTEYRFILKLKILQNNQKATNKNIDLLLEQYFGDQVIFTDRENMTISYIFQSNIERLVTIAQSEDLLPKPAGVGLSVAFTPDITSIFTMIQYGESAPSWGQGFALYGATTTGGWLGYE